MAAESGQSRVNVLMIGSGEYTTGYVHGKGSQSDKSKGGRENESSLMRDREFSWKFKISCGFNIN